MDHSIIMAAKATNDPPKNLCIDYWFYVTALNSEKNHSYHNETED